MVSSVADLPKAEIEGEVNLGDNIEVRVAEIDPTTKAITLTMKSVAKKRATAIAKLMANNSDSAMSVLPK